VTAVSMKQKSTGSKPTAPAGAIGKSKSRSLKIGIRYPFLAICVLNKGNEGSLEVGKAYRVTKLLPNDPPNRIRVIDEEGEDYLYLADWFVPLDLSGREKKRVFEAVGG
jgi:hypothetical protein